MRLPERLHRGLLGVALGLGLVGCQDFDLVQDPSVLGVPNPPDLSARVQVDRTLQVTVPAVDVLWVVDNSCSMLAEQERLNQNFPRFMTYFENSDLDYHIGVVSTDMRSLDGRGVLQDQSGFRWIDRETPSPDLVFRSLTSLGTLGDATERGRDAAWTALVTRRFTENYGFYREDAALSVIVISDEDDQSDLDVISLPDFITNLPALKATPDMVTFSSIVGPVGGCETISDRSDFGTLTVTIDGVTYSSGDGFLSVDGRGAWVLDLDGSGQILVPGSYEVVVEQTDTAGNASVDRSTTELNISEFTGPAALPQHSDLTGPTLHGTYDADDLQQLDVTVAGQTYTAGTDVELAVDSATGTWSLDLTGAGLAEGTYDVEVSQTRLDASVSDDLTVDELVIDLTPPGVPSYSGFATTDRTPVLAGSYDPTDFGGLSVTLDGVTYVSGDRALNAENGTWTLTLDDSGQRLVPGTYDVQIEQRDRAGNATADVTTDELTIDAAQGPSVEPLATNNASPVLHGAYDPSAYTDLTVAVDGVTYTESADGELSVDSTAGTWRLDLSAASRISGSGFSSGSASGVRSATTVLGTLASPSFCLVTSNRLNTTSACWRAWL